MQDGFMTEEEIVDDLIKHMSVEDRQVLRGTPANYLIMFHHGPGTRIRNYYRLWDAKNPFTDNNDAQGDNFADQVSQRIIVKAWEKLRVASTNQA